jgi:hypothetical protein
MHVRLMYYVYTYTWIQVCMYVCVCTHTWKCAHVHLFVSSFSFKRLSSLTRDKIVSITTLSVSSVQLLD